MTALAVTLAGSQLLFAAPSHADTLDAPTGLQATGSGIETLSWDWMAGASAYRVQAGTTSGAHDLVDVTTANTSYVPTKRLPSATIYWQVAANYGSSNWSAYTQGQFDQPSAEIPQMTSPANGANLVFPENPVVYKWQPVPGAVSYDVQITDDPQFGRIISETNTKGTEFTVPTSLPSAGTYYWRVQAEMTTTKGAIVSGYPSPANAWSYTISTHAITDAQPVAPLGSGDAEAQVTDTALAWPAVPGAVKYTVQVSTDINFPNSTATLPTVTGILGTRYSPPSAWDADQYYWHVQGFDASGNALGWSTTWRFQRLWPGTPTLRYPADGATLTDSQHVFFQWDPVPHASDYQFQISNDPTFPSSTNSTKTCQTTNTTFTPYYVPSPDWTTLTPKCIMLTPGGQYYWRVQALDSSPSSSSLAGIPATGWTAGRSFVYDPAAGTGFTGPATVFTAALSGTGLLSAPGPGNTDQCIPTNVDGCHDMPSTPVVTWPAQAGVQGYAVRVFHDQEMKNPYDGAPAGEPDYDAVVPDAMWTPPTQFADSNAGDAYWVYVTPCPTVSQFVNTCAGVPGGVSATAQFNKASTAIHLCGATVSHAGNPDLNGVCATDTDPQTLPALNDNVTLDWSDYLTTSKDDAEQGAAGSAATSSPGVEARDYQVQVATDNAFTSGTNGSILDDVTVDQTTFTSFANTYPDGPIYWRVRAIDGTKNPLTWSPVASFTKASAPPALTSPADNASAPRTPVLTWASADNAASYNVEVYRATGDTVFNTANRVVPASSATTPASTLRTSWTFSAPLAPGTYIWRVQRVDANTKKRTSPWSADKPADARAFTVTTASFDVSSPSDGAQLSPDQYTFTWPAADGAATYRFERRQPGTSTVAESTGTAALAWAPTTFPANNTTWQWRVVPVDSSGNDLSPSPWRTFSFVSGPTAAGPLAVDGSANAQVGSALTAQVPAWSLSPGVVTTWQWYYSSVSASNAISGATNRVYTPRATENGKVLLVRATGTKAGYQPGTVTSAPITVGKGAGPTAPPIEVQGSGAVGVQLTGAVDWDTGGNDYDVTTTYKWVIEGTDTFVASGNTYTPKPSDLGKALVLQATGRPSNAAFANGTASSAPVDVTAGSKAYPTVQPSISGTPGLGNGLYASRGTWANTDYSTKYTYRWQRPTGGWVTAASSSAAHTVTKADIGKWLRVVVTATTTGYTKGTAYSAAVYVPKVPTTISAFLSPSMVKVHTHGKVIVSLYTPRLTGPTGTLKVFIDGHKRVTKTLYAGALGKKSIRLPKLKKGTHKVQVRYLGSKYTKAKRSTKMKLTVYK